LLATLLLFMSPSVEVADLPTVANVMELNDVIKVRGQASILLGVDMVESGMVGRVIHTSATPHSGKISGQKFCGI